MKARFNVDGKQLEVVAINYYADEMSSITTVDESGNFLTYHDTEYGSYIEKALSVDLKKSVEFPEIRELVDGKLNQLFQHLDELFEKESALLTDLAIDAMESDELPFERTDLLNHKKEYKLLQQRVFGILDAIEEAKAFSEGFYDKNGSTEKEGA